MSVGWSTLTTTKASGLGRSLAHQYSERGGKVCVVGRRRDELEKVLAECLALRPGPENDGVLIHAGDFTNVDDMVRVRAFLQTTWGGLDTLAVCAGVSALRPLLEVAGLERHATSEASPEGIHRVVEVSNAAFKGNFTGPLVSAVTFVSHRLNCLITASKGEDGRYLFLNPPRRHLPFYSFRVWRRLFPLQHGPFTVRQSLLRWFSTSLLPSNIQRLLSLSRYLLPLRATSEHPPLMAENPGKQTQTKLD
ncbi:hypothetical protein PHLCEN_2v754 [Hermanssonia centrifuga]|uniref:Uncharacterized protein n=1 Tax=Hermanssonia centrifuga TaxID=98765 RepID=A0A2R6S521_9APHY|nr:hypothetical protein PHLCEN_2v754 [Hermanssonia centrifuga]